MATYVLIPGAGGDAWYWHLVGPLLEAAGIDISHRLYDPRHTMATLLLRGGESIVTVSKRLGHAMVTLTLNVYASAMP